MTSSPASKIHALLLCSPIVFGACGDPEVDAGTNDDCAGGKCDDVEPADFACKELIDRTTRGSANVLTELHDPFAHFVLKTGEEGCPSTFAEVMDRLRAEDSEGCDQGPEAGIRTRVVTETGQLFEDGNRPANPLMRAVTTRRCGGRQEHELVFSVFGASPSSMPANVEVMAFDEEAREFNYYTVENGEVAFHGSSSDIVTGKADRCDQCHTGGGMVMKELDTPWVHWENRTHGAMSDGQALVDAHEDFGSHADGLNMESITNAGNRAWNETRVALLTDPQGETTVADMLRPLFCGTEFNIDTAVDFVGRQVESIPVDFFVDPTFQSFGSISMSPDVYAAAIQAAGQQVPQLGRPDTIFPFAFIERAKADIDYIDRLRGAGVLDENFIEDVLAIDFTRPVFSDQRCGLLEFAPTWADLDEPSEPEPGGTTGGTTGGSDETGGSTTGDGAETGASDVGSGGVDDGGASPDASTSMCCQAQPADTQCDDAAVRSCVCDGDAFCCETAWDGLCVDAAVACGATCEAPAAASEGPRLTTQRRRIAAATPESLRAAFIANLQAADLSGNPAAARFLSHLLAQDDGQTHRDRVEAFLTACEDRDERALMDDIMQVVTLARRRSQESHVMEFPATVPATNLEPSPEAHLDPATCELAE